MISEELQIFIEEQFETLRKEITDKFQIARKQLLTANEATQKADQTQDS